MMGLYIATQQVVPLGLSYVSKQLEKGDKDQKNMARAIEYLAIPGVKIGGYYLTSRAGLQRTTDLIDQKLDKHRGSHHGGQRGKRE